LGLAVLGLLVLLQEAARGRFLATGYRNVRAFSGYAGTSLRTWSRTSGRIARLRLETARLLRDRNRAQFALGAAAYANDGAAGRDLIAAMRAIDAKLAECAA